MYNGIRFISIVNWFIIPLLPKQSLEIAANKHVNNVLRGHFRVKADNSASTVLDNPQEQIDPDVD